MNNIRFGKYYMIKSLLTRYLIDLIIILSDNDIDDGYGLIV